MLFVVGPFYGVQPAFYGFIWNCLTQHQTSGIMGRRSNNVISYLIKATRQLKICCQVVFSWVDIQNKEASSCDWHRVCLCFSPGKLLDVDDQYYRALSTGRSEPSGSTKDTSPGRTAAASRPTRERAATEPEPNKPDKDNRYVVHWIILSVAWLQFITVGDTRQTSFSLLTTLVTCTSNQKEKPRISCMELGFCVPSFSLRFIKTFLIWYA